MKFFTTVESLLSERFGIVPSTLGPNVLTLAVKRRCDALSCNHRFEYLEKLQTEADEMMALIDEIVVPESWFFRDVVPFERLSQALAKRVKEYTPLTPLRVLSVPCAHGEEPYSIGISLLNLGLKTDAFYIKGVDVSQRVLTKARQGVFNSLSFRGENLDFRDYYFEPQENNRYRIKEPLRSHVTFEVANITDPLVLFQDSPYDVIFCRNVLIYFDKPSRERTLRNLDRLLNPNGLLFVGHAEANSAVGRLFAAKNWPGAFAYGKLPVSPKASRPPLRPKKVAVKRSPAFPPDRNVPASVSEKTESQPRPSGQPPQERQQKAKATAKLTYNLSEAHRLADAGQMQEAMKICDKYLEVNGPSSQALFLIGIMYLAGEEKTKARKLLEQAVYLNPQNQEAMNLLSHIASSQGDQAEAKRWKDRLNRVATREVSP